MTQITDKIIEILPKLTKKQKIIGRYICDNLYEVALLNSSNIARNSGASEATLTRFIYTLGYKSFSDFQLALRKQTQGRNQDIPFCQEILETENSTTLTQVLSFEQSMIREAQENIDPKAFDESVKKILSADRVLIIGGGVCDFIAIYFLKFLSIFRDNVFSVNKLDLEFIGILQSMGPKSVTIAISYPRYPKSVQNLLLEVKKKHIPIIGITDSVFSPISSIATYNLYTPQKYYIFVSSYAAVFALLHAILVEIYKCDTKNVKNRLRNYEKMVLDMDMFESKNYDFTTVLK